VGILYNAWMLQQLHTLHGNVLATYLRAGEAPEDE
jgi:hypothetical protein